ncbi:MAG: EamA family transporter [Anaerolineae bacterium]|nr:EamA family transporter [Anaerolineae bacterium]
MPIPRWRIIAAFAAVYLIWGSSYLAIRIAIETVPPFLSAGVRFGIAGIMLLVWARSHGQEMPSRKEWGTGFLSGAFMFVFASGGIAWATQYVPSGITALLNATLPVWMVLLDWLVYHHARPGLPTFTGLSLGIVGLLLLIEPGPMSTASPLYGIAMLITAAAPISWAAGSLLAREKLGGRAPLVTTGMQLTAGGLLLIVLSLFSGEVHTFQLDAVSLRSSLALLYLVFGSSIVAFGSFMWLMRVEDPGRVSTYAFVNPVLALYLGSLLADEALTPRTLLAAAIILSGVLLITYRKRLALPRWLRPRPAATGIQP